MTMPGSHSMLVIAETDALLRQLARAAQGAREVVLCASLDAALLACRARRPELVLISLGLFNSGGARLCAPREEGGEHLPVVVVAEVGSELAALESLRAGAVDHMIRTEASMLDLPRILDRALREWRFQHVASGEAQFRALFENMSLGVCMVSIEGRLLEVNPRMGEIFGYSPEELVGVGVNDITHPEDQSISPLFIESSVNGEVESAVFEKRYLHKDGHVVFGRVSSRLVRTQGEPRYFVSAVEDLTAQRQSEREAEENQVLLANIMDNSPALIYAYDVEGRCLFLNERAAQAFGRDREGFLGRSRDSLPLSSEHAAQHRGNDLEVIRRVELLTLKEHCVIADVELTFQTHKFPLLDSRGEVYGVCGISMDITEQERAVEELRDSEERFRVAFETTGHGMAIVSLEGRFLRINQTFCDILGFDMSQMLGISFRDITHPEDLRVNVESVNRLLRGESKAYKVEKRYRGAEGQTVWVILSVSLVRDHEGQPMHFVAQVIDITERRRMEAKVLESQKMDSIGNLAGGVAHDFNNMLAGIMGSASMLELLEEDPEKRRYIRNILASSERAAALTRKLLEFGRRGMTVEEPVDLNAIAKETIEILGRTLSLHNEIKRDFADDLFWVDADPSQMSQVMMNLCINAAEAMPDGGTITIRTANVLPSAELRQQYPGARPGAHVMLEVADTGCGMNSEVQQRVFEPFFTTKHDGQIKGTGLGLAVVYGIVKRHRGVLELASELGRGTKLKIFLPQSKLSPAAVEVVPSAMVRGGGKILLVDDEALLRESVSDILVHLGYEVMLAADGLEGVELFKAHHQALSLVLLDLMMPQLDGRGAFAQMRAINPDVPVVISTGHGARQEAQALLAAGARAICAKPYSVERLSQVLDEAMNES